MTGLNGDMERSVKIWSGENPDATEEDIAIMRKRLGTSTSGIPETSQISALNAEWYTLRLERKNRADDDALIKPQELERIEAAKLALGKKGIREGRPAFYRAEFIRRYGEAEYQAEKKKWGATDDVRVPGTNPYKARLREAKNTGKLPTNATSTVTVSDGKQSSNPWKIEGAVGQAARIQYITRMGTAKAVAMAKAAGLTVDGRALKI